MTDPARPQQKTKPTTLQLVWSMVAAFCGIQNSANHDRDDEYIDQVGFMPYIIIGVVLTIVFMLLLYGLVQLILS